MPNTKIYKNASSIEKKAYDLIASILDIPKLSKTYLSRLHKSAALLSSTISTTPPYAVDVNQCFDLERLAVASLLNSENTAAPSDSQMLSPGGELNLMCLKGNKNCYVRICSIHCAPFYSDNSLQSGSSLRLKIMAGYKHRRPGAHHA